MRHLVTFGANQTLVEALERYKVRFLVIGGLAVQFYDSTREADHLDLLADPTIDNARRLVRALRTMHVFPEPGAAERFAAGAAGFHLRQWSLFADILSEPVEAFAAHWAQASDAFVGSAPVKVPSAEMILDYWDRHPPKHADDVTRLERFLAMTRSPESREHEVPPA